MADVKATIVVVDEATRTIKKIDGAFDDLEKGSKRGETGLRGLTSAWGPVIAGATTFGLAVKAAFDMGQAGAELERTRGQLDSLAVSIGTTSDALLNELGAATSGMMSDAEMIRNATQIISLGLADNQTDVIRLATVVSELSWDMQQVILTFANNSTLRLDALGLSVEGVTTRAKELEEQGFNADKAFDLAVIQMAEEKIGLVGGAAETAAGQYKMLAAEVANAKDAWNAFVNKTILPALIAFNKSTDAQEMLNEALRLGMITETEWRYTVNAGAAALDENNTVVQRAEDGLKLYNYQLELEALRQMGAAAATGQADEKLMALEMTLQSAAAETEIMNDIFGDMEDAAGNAADEIGRIARAGHDLADTTTSITGWFDDVINSLKDFADPELVAARDMAVQILALMSGDDPSLNPTEARKFIEGFFEAWENGTPVMETAGAVLLGMAAPGGAMFEFQRSVGDASAEAQDLEAALQGASGDWSATFNLTVTGDQLPEIPPGAVGGQPGTTGASAAGNIDDLTGSDRAVGGPVFAGLPYIVGEHGPEPFVPDQNGTIIPNEQIRGPTTVQLVLDDQIIGSIMLNRLGSRVKQANSAGAGITGY